MTVTRANTGRPWRFHASLALTCVIGVGLLHWPTLFLGVEPDTLLAIRPWSSHELREALTGTWLFPTVDFYHRPLATLWFAADFTAVGLNSRALHGVSLLLLAATAWLLLEWIWAEAGAWTGVAVLTMYLTHPQLLDSTIAGAQYQFHMAPLVIVTATLLLWRHRRHTATLTGWWPMLLLPCLGFYFKEDTIVVVPAMLVLQTVRARRFGDVPPPSRSLLWATLAIVVVLGGIRWVLFPHVETLDGLTGRLNLEGLRIAAYAPARAAFAMFARAELLPGATAFVLLLQVAGGRAAWRRPTSPEGWIWMCGLVLLVATCLPLTITAEIRSTRVHLAVLSAALMLGAGGAALWNLVATAGRASRIVTAGVLIAGSMTQWQTQRLARVERFEPCATEQLTANDYAQHWPEITPDLRDWLRDMPRRCSDGHLPTPEDDLASIRWSSDARHVVLVHRSARRADLVFAPPTQDTAVIVIVDGASQAMTLSAHAPTLSLTLAPTWRTWLRRDYRVDVYDARGGSLPALSAVRVK